MIVDFVGTKGQCQQVADAIEGDNRVIDEELEDLDYKLQKENALLKSEVAALRKEKAELATALSRANVHGNFHNHLTYSYQQFFFKINIFQSCDAT